MCKLCKVVDENLSASCLSVCPPLGRQEMSPMKMNNYSTTLKYHEFSHLILGNSLQWAVAFKNQPPPPVEDPKSDTHPGNSRLTPPTLDFQSISSLPPWNSCLPTLEFHISGKTTLEFRFYIGYPPWISTLLWGYPPWISESPQQGGCGKNAITHL